MIRRKKPRARFSRRLVPGLRVLAVVVLFMPLSTAAAPALVSFDQARALYDQNKMAEALPLLEQLAAQDGHDARVHAWLADTYRRLGRKDEAISAARLALESDSCNSFAHVVLAAVYSPGAKAGPLSASDSTWVHLLKAVECDSTDGNAWEYVTLESIRRGEPALRKRSLRMLVESGHLTPAALAYGRWSLRTLPQDAILLTNGDLDTYPALALQELEGLRRDVVVAERGLLGAPWFLRFIRDQEGVPLPFEDSQLDTLSKLDDGRGNTVPVSGRVLRGWLDRKAHGAFDRPICVAVTVEESFLAGIKEHLQAAGPFRVWHPKAAGGVPDILAMRVSLEGIRDEEFAGPWAGPRDRSPVHRLYSKQVVANVTGMAVTYADWMIRVGRVADGERVLEWAEKFEPKTELGPVFTQRIAELREAAKKQAR
jgi:hypothetical protein